MTRRTMAGFGLVLLVACLLARAGAPTALSAAPPTPTPAVTPRPGERTYTVESGDSVWTIAVKFYGNGNKYSQILAANNLPESVRLRVGQVLIIPGVAAADTMPTSAPPADVLPTLAQPSSIPTLRQISLPTALPTLVAVVSVPTTAPPSDEKKTAPTTRPSSSILSVFATPEFMRLLDILSGILAGSSFVCAMFAYQAYTRAQRLQRLTRVRRRSRVHIDHLT